jgi:hypothetical protein
MEKEPENLLVSENKEIIDEFPIRMTSVEFPTFDIMFEVLNNFSQEITLEFREDGIRIISLNEYQTVLLFVKLYSINFQHYQTTPLNNNVSFNLTALCNFIKLGKKEKQINKESFFAMRVDNNMIYFDFINELNKETFTYKQNRLENNVKEHKLPAETKFTKSIVIDMDKFFPICTMFKKYSNYVTFSCDNHKFVMDTGEISKTFCISNHMHIIALNTSDGTNDNINATYNLDYLINLKKLSYLSTECQIYLKNDYPMFLHIPIGALGKMLIGFSPVETHSNS